MAAQDGTTSPAADHGAAAFDPVAWASPAQKARRKQANWEQRSLNGLTAVLFLAVILLQPLGVTGAFAVSSAWQHLNGEPGSTGIPKEVPLSQVVDTKDCPKPDKVYRTDEWSRTGVVTTGGRRTRGKDLFGTTSVCENPNVAQATVTAHYPASLGYSLAVAANVALWDRLVGGAWSLTTLFVGGLTKDSGRMFSRPGVQLRRIKWARGLLAGAVVLWFVNCLTGRVGIVGPSAYVLLVLMVGAEVVYSVLPMFQRAADLQLDTEATV